MGQYPINQRRYSSYTESEFGFVAERESDARTYANSIGRVLMRGRGTHVWDREGNDYLDCLACAGTLALGHNHPDVNARIVEFLSTGAILQALDITTPIKARFIEAVFSVLPSDFALSAKIQFCGPTGADAVEAAAKLFKTSTGRRTVLAFTGGYHGMTAGALAMTGNLTAKSSVASLMPDVHVIPFPYAFRCPFGIGDERGSELSLAYIERLLSDPESGVTKPAMILLEAVQGEGGVIPAPDSWLRGLRDIATHYDVPLVVDEIQTGFGRTGDMFAFEHAGITPDAILVSKAIGGGFPLSALIYNEAYDRWKPGAHAGTFRGNQIAMSAGVAMLEVMRPEDVLTNVAVRGREMGQGLAKIAARHAVVGEIRGRGLMWGVEIINPNGPPDRFGHAPADGNFAYRLKIECLKQGLIVETGGRYGSVLRLLPPLNLTQSDASECLRKLANSFDALAQASNRHVTQDVQV